MFITIFYYFDILKMIKYTKLLYSIKNKNIRKCFFDITSDEYLSWDKIKYETLCLLNKTSYKEFETNNDKFNKLLVLSEPETWIFFIEDNDFHEYINKFDFYDLYRSNHNDKFKLVLDLLLELYPEKFKLNLD